MKNRMMILASACMMMFAFAIVPATAATTATAIEVSISDCENCNKEGCTGCEGKKEEAKKECAEGEKKAACCAHGSKKAEKKTEKKTEEAKK